jgi:opacity protein-like surface antigen
MKTKGERMKRIILVLCAALCMAAAQNAMAQSDLGLKRVGGTIGIVDPENLDTVLGFGLLGDWGTITPDIRLESHLDYWSKSETLYGGGEASMRDVALGARGRYFFHVSGSAVRPFAGAGLGLHFLHAEVSFPAQDLGGTIIPAMTVGDSSTKLGLDLGGGIETALSPRTDLLADLWYGMVSDVNQLSMRIGLTYKLGSR